MEYKGVDLKSAFELDDRNYAKIKKIVFKTTGIRLGDNKRSLVISRLAKRLMKLEIFSFEEYVERLTENPVEVVELVNSITTNHTFFYREPIQFQLLKDEVLPTMLNQLAKQGLRVWSAACSNGAEVYSILFTLIAYFGGEIPDELDFRILGSDIDTNMLLKAQKGIYQSDELDKLAPLEVETFFDKEGPNQYCIKDSVRKYAIFRKINLVYDDFTFKKEIDIIFCRNVAIYFDNQTKHTLYSKFHQVMSVDGFLFSGQSENLFKWSDKFKFYRNSVYKKVS